MAAAESTSEAKETLKMVLKEGEVMLEKMKNEKKVALFLDESGRFETYLAFQNTTIIEAKQILVQKIQGQKTEDEIKEDLRKKIVGAMTAGNILLIRMDNSAVDMNAYCDENKFPEELFDVEEFLKESICGKLITKEDEMRWAGFPRDGFQIVITSKFNLDDACDFLPAALPNFDNFTIIEIAKEN